MKKTFIVFTLINLFFQSCLVLPKPLDLPSKDANEAIKKTNQNKKTWNADQEEISTAFRCFNLVNNYRQKNGLKLLLWNDDIASQCFSHSKNMGTGNTPFNHQGFEDRISAINQNLQWLSAGENIASNRGFEDPAEKAIAGWINSQGHHANIVGDFSHSAMGVFKNAKGEWFFTQIFIKAK